MKIKYTQIARKADVDTDLALAVALVEDEAGISISDDDDFQSFGSSPVFFNQSLALRNCAVKKHGKKRVLPKNLRLGKKERGGNEVGDSAQGAFVPGKEIYVHCDAVSEVVLESKATATGLVSKDMEHRFREPKKTDKRVLKDHNGRSVECVSTETIVLVKGDENGNEVGSGKLQQFSMFNIPNLEPKNVQDSTDQRIGSSLPSDCFELQGQSQDISGTESKRKTEPCSFDTAWSLLNGGTKRVKTTAEVPENAGNQRLEESAGLDSLSFEGEEVIEIDLGAEIDEDMVICTQVEVPNELECSQYAGELGKKSMEDRAKRKHNIYDILLGKNRTDRFRTMASNPTIDEEFECDDAEDLENPGTALRALIDEAELDYEELDHNEENTESTDSLEFSICGANLVDLPFSDREQHVSDCLEKDDVTCTRTNPVDCLGQEAVTVVATEIAHPSNQRAVTIETLECPVCGICIEELSTAEREVHANACLEKHNIPSSRENPGDYLDPEAGRIETDEASDRLTSQRNVIVGTLLCPVCGVCIEELSTAQRESHTNSCLDDSQGEGQSEDIELAGAEVDQALDKPGLRPVVTWLTSLNLEKYVDTFVKQEIDLDTLKCLTEEDLNSLGITALGPRRKIVCAIQQLRKPEFTTEMPTAMQDSQRISDSAVLSPAAGSKKSIADFFILPPNTRQRVPAPDVSTLANSKAPGTVIIAGGSARTAQGRPFSAGRNFRSVRPGGVPTWMCIPGTSFRVDAFKYTTGSCSNYFLTHFHADHYQGLTKGFRHGKIFCSLITARLVNLRIGVPWDRIQALPLNETVLIDGVRVTFIDANHCPGSVMILFEPPNGKAVLHTGDFRFCSEMACNEILKACRITTLILDTTYCDPQYDFPKQDVVVQFVIDAIQAEAFNTKTLFLIGTYTIGKERIFLEVGKILQKYIYVGAAKKRLLDCMDLPEEDKRWLTTKDQESHIHVVPLWSVASFQRMGSISRHYHGRYNSIVAFSPTGWSFGKDKKRIQSRPGRRYQQGSVIRYEVPYSEHSSFTELKEFVRIIGAEKIIPHVFGRKGLSADAMVATLLREEKQYRWPFDQSTK